MAVLDREAGMTPSQQHRGVERGRSTTRFPIMGSTPIVSSNLQDTSSGVVCAIARDDGSNPNLEAFAGKHQLVLRAYNAQGLATVDDSPFSSIFPSSLANYGTWNDTRAFIMPTVVNGKVFAASENMVSIFHL